MTPAWVRSLLRSDAGAVAPLAAVALAVVIGLAGLVVDVGVWYVQRGNLQSATDNAAMGAANELGTASQVAGTLLGQNGYSAANLVSTETGYYCPSAAVAVANRFSTTPCVTGDETPSAPNAVRLRTQTTGPALLTRVLGGTGAQITTTAVAARIDEVGLTAGSGLATVNLSLANGVLGSLVGGSGLSLSLVQYNGLLNTNVDAKLFFNALAANLGVTAGTYGQLLQTQASVNQVIQASIDALNQQNSIADVSAAISGLQAIQAKLTGNPQITLGQLFDLGVWRDEPLSSSGPSALEAGLNAYQLATFALQLGNGAHAATIPTSGLNIPGLVSATVQATAIEPPQSAYFAFGPAGAPGVEVHTAQVRLQLAIQVLGSTLQVPLYVEVAQGDAKLNSIACGVDPANDAVVKVQATTGIASVYIGQVAANAMSNFSAPVTVSSAPLVSVLGVTVGAKVAVTAGSSNSTTLTFIQAPATGIPANLSLTTQGYIARLASLNGPAASSGWPAQVVSTGILGGVGTGLASGLSTASLQLCVLSACSGSVGGIVGAAVGTVISTVINPVLMGIDPLIDQILESLGVQLGTTEVLVSGLRCGVPVLVA